jgi:hypothetical protein
VVQKQEPGGQQDGRAATSDLSRFLADLVDDGAISLKSTLSDIRGILLGDDLFMSNEGEIMYRADRASLLVELDELIEQHSASASLEHLIDFSPG